MRCRYCGWDNPNRINRCEKCGHPKVVSDNHSTVIPRLSSSVWSLLAHGMLPTNGDGDMVTGSCHRLK